jgi:4-amino-4-deoxy-L-arabinose transferase-like glycosyltransferase
LFTIPRDRQVVLTGLSLFVLTLAIYVIRLTGPTDLEADAQQRIVGYVMDAVWRGNWLVQTEVRGWLMSKPPFHTWVVAGFAGIFGINRITLTLPSALAVFGMAWLAYLAGRRSFRGMAGVYAGVACVLAPMMSRHVALVRTDAFFAFAVTIAALAAYRAWERRDGWVLFWLASAVATLTKGPLGLALGAMGLLAFFWERRGNPSAKRPAGPLGSGIGLFLAITLGWLAWATYRYGYPLIDKLFFDELFGQVTGMRKDITPGENIWKPAFFFLIRFAPFSLFAIYGLWRIVRQPAVDETERRFERFLFCWLIGGMLLFSLGAHFRADLLLPLWPAAAILAGREMARLAAKLTRPLIGVGTALVAMVLIGVSYWHYHPKAKQSKEIRYSVEADLAGRALADSGLDLQRIWHLNAPVTMQMHLGVYRPWISESAALDLLRTRPDALLAVSNPSRYPKLFGAEGMPLHEVFRWPQGGKDAPLVSVFALGEKVQVAGSAGGQHR